MKVEKVVTKLSDNSKVYDLFVYDGVNGFVELNCVGENHANRLRDLLADCVNCEQANKVSNRSQ